MGINENKLVVAASCPLLLSATVAYIYSADYTANKANYLSDDNQRNVLG